MEDLEIEDFLPSKDKCAKVLRSVRWGEGVSCVYCNSQKVVKNGFRDDYIQKYLCNSCSKVFNDRTKTLFSETRMQLDECFYTIKAFNDGKSKNRIRKEIDRNWETIDNLLKRLSRHIKPSKLIEKAFTGNVEIDEAYINAGNKGTPQEEPRERGLKMRGRGTYEKDRPPVIGIVERGGKMLLTVTHHADRETVEDLVEDIDEDAIVNTDEFKTYNFLDQEFKHRKVNHSKGEYAKKDGTHVNTIEGLFSHLRGWLHTFKGVCKRYLQHYINFFNIKHLLRHLNPVQKLNQIINHLI
jgi:transposase-like protein